MDFVGARVIEGLVDMPFHMSQFEVAHAEFVRQRTSAIHEQPGGCCIVREYAPVVDIRQAYQESAKEQATDISEGQDPTRLLFLAGLQAKGDMLQAALQNDRPGRMLTERQGLLFC